MSDTTSTPVDARRTVRLIGLQAATSIRAFVRNRAAAFFTLAFPLMFLIVFNLLSSGSRVPTGDGTTESFAQYFTPGIATFGIITACFTSLAISVTTARDLGILKRVRGTPLPGWIYLAGRIIGATTAALASVVVLTGVSIAFFDVQIVWHAIPAAVVTVLLGAACFCALGLALTAAIPNAESAPPITNATIFPLLFVSGIFFPMDGAPQWVVTLAKVFPIQHLANALQTDYLPTVAGSGFMWHDLLALAAWTVVGAGLAVTFFRWDPQADRRRTSRPTRRHPMRQRRHAPAA